MPWRLIVGQTPDSWFSAKCCVCHTGTESRSAWLDGDIDVEGEGAYLICVPCVVEAAGLLNMTTEEAVDALLCRALAAESEVDGLQAELAEARALIEALRRYDAGSPLATPAPAASPGPDVVSSPSAPEDVAAAVDAELALGPVLPHPCPDAGCDRAFTSPAAAGAHAFRKHGRRSGQ